MVELWAREREISEGIANCGKLKKEGKVREQREREKRGVKTLMDGVLYCQELLQAHLGPIILVPWANPTP